MKRTIGLFITLLFSLITQSQVNLTQGLIAYYPFNGNANDATGGGNNGVVMNGAQLTTDRFGNPNSAYHFNGIDDYIIINDNGSLSPQSVSVCAYVNTESTSSQIAVGKIEYSTGNGATYNLGINYDVQTGFFSGITPSTVSCTQQYPYDPSNPFVKSTADFSTNSWHCLVTTFENAVIKLYVDGVLVNTRTTTFNNLLQCNNTQLLIGSWWSGDLSRFQGKIDDVRIYNRAINQQEVAALCNVTTGSSLCTGSLGDPVVNITFGSGNNPGQPLSTIVPGASTSLGYVAVTGNPANPTPVDGQYTITNNVPFNVDWFSGAQDHTPNNPNGYMAFYNGSEQPGEFYQQTINNLCGSTTYEFAAWIANALNPAAYIGVNPDVTFRIEQTDGTLLGFFDTGPITQNSTFTWVQYGFNFTVPANVSTLVLRMINNSPGGTANFGNDLAIDDITFRPCGPITSASFTANSMVDSTGVCEGAATTLFGTISTGYITPNYLWQVSKDNGNTWADLPNSNGLQINTTPPVTGNAMNYRYRMMSGEGNNINSANCRTASNLIILSVSPGPLLTITPDTGICQGSTIQLQVSGASAYNWSSSPYLSNLNISSPLADPPVATKFFVTGLDNSNCKTSDSVTVSIRPKPVFQLPTDTIVCKGSSVKLNGNNGINYSYSWSPATFLDDPTSPNPLANPDINMVYSVKITDKVCQYDSNFQITVSVAPIPIVSAQKSNDIDCNNPTAQLTVTGAETYSWTPASGVDDPNKPNPIASIDTSTTFLVKGTDKNGCSSSGSVSVKVSAGGKASFLIPNSFTPNGDGHNDCFGIRRWGNVTIEEFSIYNRWGQRIFTTKNPSDCWDGNFNGVPQHVGGYPYVIKAKSFCGDIIRKGIVLLIR